MIGACNTGSVYTSCLSAVLQATSAHGLDRLTLLRDAGIQAEILELPGERISIEQYMALYRLALERSGDTDLGLAVGHITYFMGMNLHLYMTTICRNLKEYLNVIPSTIRLRGDLGRVLIQPAGDHIRLEWHAEHGATRSFRALEDEMLLSSAKIVGSICALPVPVVKAEFTYAQPADTQALQAAFRSDLEFGSDVSCLYFARDSLRYPLIDPGFELGSEFKAGPEAMFDHSDTDDQFLRDTRAAMRRALPIGDLTIDALAEAMSVSRRTLQRRLESRSCNFKQLLQALREELSLRYLDESRLAITEIALLLGYSDQASFSNAFRAWRGCSPSEYRNQQNKLAVGS